jgi:hypothetical protein
MTIRAHIFDTQEECQSAIDLINVALGLPNSHHSTHSNPMQSGCGKWFIQADSHSVNVLGDGVEFELVQPSFDDFV